jgi:multiple sugar transport system permease protein
MAQDQNLASATGAHPRRGGSLSQRTQEALLGYLCITPWLIGFLVLQAGALLYSFYLGFSRADMFTGVHFVRLANYERLLRDTLFLKSLGVTARYALGSVPLGVVLALSVALMLNQKLPGQGLWRTLYYLPSIVSGIAVAILWGWMFNTKIGLINSSLRVIGIEGPRWLSSETWALPALIIMSLWGVGGNMLLYLGGLQSIPTALYDAAKIDGANALHRLLSVTLPMLSPTIFFTTVMGIIGALQVFTQSYVMTGGGPNNATLTAVLYIYRRSFEQLHFGYASAMAWVLFLIILLCTLVVFRSSSFWVYYEAELKK